MSTSCIEQIAESYRQGRTLREIAALFQVSPETIRRSLVDAEVPLRSRGAPLGKYRPKDGQVDDARGYRLVRLPDHPAAIDGYIRRSRMVAEGRLGRFLTDDEVVAHLDGNPSNDSVENLRVFASRSSLAEFLLGGNTHAKGDVGNPKRRRRRRRSKDQMLWDLATLHQQLGRPIRRADLTPPHPSWRAVQRAFGSWQAGVELALRVHPFRLPQKQAPEHH